MKTIKINPDETGWIKIDGSVKTVVAHFKDGHKETFSLVDFLIFKQKTMSCSSTIRSLSCRLIATKKVKK